MNYLFHLGHSPALAQKELIAVLTRQGIKFQKENAEAHLVIIHTKQSIVPEDLIEVLGGTVRIAAQVERVIIEPDKHQDLCKACAIQIVKANSNASQAEFAISDPLNATHDKDISRQVKNLLKKQNVASRYVLSDSKLLSPIQFNPSTQELILMSGKNRGEVLIFQTKAVTDVRAWQRRDRKRPEVDAYSGVLPPKVARMMVNVGLAQAPESPVILDSFCGSGTILMEALVSGYQALGFDISPKAVSDTQENLHWLDEQGELPSWRVALGDAREVRPVDLDMPRVDVIISEGYLGPARFESDQLSGIVDELGLLYSRALPNLSNWLKPGGRLVLALPFFQTPPQPDFQQKLIDTATNAGYTFAMKPVTYGHSKARVKRTIFVLDKHK